MLQGDTPRLTDFGLARTLALDTTTCQIAGTPAYMAPEAFDGVRSVQSDLWSVGVMLYRLLTHRLPFSSDDLGTLVQLIRREHPTPLPQSIPLQVRSAVFHALEKDPDKRYSTALEMEQALRGNVHSPSPVVLEQSDPAAASDTTKQQAVADTHTSSTGVPRLVVGSGRSAGTVYRIDKERFLIGRDRSCDARLVSDFVSRMHAQLVQTDDGFAIEDLGTGNGTFVNGRRVKGRVVLHDYDRIHLGGMILVYRTSDEEPGDSHV
jgi:serine/threonine protein kinase